jgi:FtsH-binding integral membrane protein
VLLWALLALIVFGIVAIFVSIPHANLIWAVAGLVIFGGYTPALRRLLRARARSSPRRRCQTRL